MVGIAASENPIRGWLVDLNNPNEFWEFPMNPTNLEEVVGVTWKQQAVVGMSHPIPQYGGTEAHSLPSVEFVVDRYKMSREKNKDLTPREFLAFERFLLSLTVPPRGAENIAGGSPPRVLFVWPNTVSLVCIVSNVTIRHERFAHDGSSTLYRARVTFSEIRDTRMTSEEIYNDGSQRGGWIF